jgi:hypothetical protein
VRLGTFIPKLEEIGVILKMAFKIKSKPKKKVDSWNLPMDNILGADRKTYVGARKEPKGKNSVFVADYDGKEHSFTMKDLASFFIQSRGFPPILKLGNVYGEGQSGGREVSDMAHSVENKFIEKYGEEEYKRRMAKGIKSLGG